MRRSLMKATALRTFRIGRDGVNRCSRRRRLCSSSTGAVSVTDAAGWTLVCAGVVHPHFGRPPADDATSRCPLVERDHAGRGPSLCADSLLALRRLAPPYLDEPRSLLQRLYHRVHCLHGACVAIAIRSAPRQQLGLEIGQDLLDHSRHLVHRDGLLGPSPPTRLTGIWTSGERDLPGGEVARTNLQAHRHAPQLLLIKLPAGGIRVAVIQLHADARA